jgi:hypothetical protein
MAGRLAPASEVAGGHTIQLSFKFSVWRLWESRNPSILTPT